MSRAGDAPTHQADLRNRDADAPADHRQDVVLGRGGHHLYGEVREASAGATWKTNGGIASERCGLSDAHSKLSPVPTITGVISLGSEEGEG